MTKFFKILCIALMFGLCSLTYADTQVIATGQAAGRGKIARQQALADALRQAVRKGAGVNVISSTKVTDYVLDFDRIFSRAFGYVKSFTILSARPDKTGIYNVKITATVSKSSPGMNDYMAMRQIIALKGSPRLFIKTSGQINGIANAAQLVDGQLREIALKCGFQTIKISEFNRAESKRAKRDKMLDRERNSSFRSDYDFIINAEISGTYNGKSELYGVSTQRFSFGADLGATYPNGNAIAQVTIPSLEIDIAKVSDKTQAARTALHKTLGADKGRNFRALLLRILASWVSEFDSGAKITVELPKISNDLFETIVDRLKRAKGVNAIYVREFDENLKSFIELESNLKAYDLARLISILSDNKFKADRVTNDYIQMSNAKAFGASDLVIILFGAIIVFIIFMLMLKNRKKS